MNNLIKRRYFDHKTKTLKYVNGISIDIGPADYDTCVKSAHNMWARKKHGQWGEGYINTADDPECVERTGRLGEFAFCNVFNTIPDFSYIEKGDITDTILNGKLVDVKTQRTLYGMLVKCENNGVETPLRSDIYVQCYVSHEDRIKKVATIDILGYIYKSELIKKPRVPKEIWVNYKCSYLDLHPIIELLHDTFINI